MGIFSRISDIVNSNINAMLDRAENPEKLVRLIIVEMEDTLAEIKADAASSVANRMRMEREMDRAKQAVEEWEEKAQLALAKSKDELAREALEQKLVAQKTVDVLGERYEEVVKQSTQFQKDIQRLEEKLAMARRKQNQLAAKHARVIQRKKVESQLYRANQTQALAKIERIEYKLDRLQAETDLMEKSNQTLDQQFRDLEWEGKLDKEFEELKTRAKQKKAG